MQSRQTLIAATALALCGGAVQAADASATVSGRDGNALGTVSATGTESGMVIVTISMTGLPDGIHGAHLHQTGDCSAEDFSSAGGHISGDASHGVYSADGPHPGDMPNITVQSDGAAQIEFFLHDLDIDADLLDADGAAFVLHAGMDDYRTDPAGDSGERIACGAFAAGG